MPRDYAKDLADYVTVNQRLEAFYKQWPAGSIESEIVQHRSDLIVVKARAFRWPNDTNPGTGHSSLEIPGTTPYTRGSELENAETSAWGRALAALGFEVKRGVATADEIANKHDPLAVDSNEEITVRLGSPEHVAAMPRPSCPKCGNVGGFLRDKSGAGWFCWKKRDGCGANFTDAEYEAAKPKPDDSDIDWNGTTIDTSSTQEQVSEGVGDGSLGPLDDKLAPTPILEPKGRLKAAKLLSDEQARQLGMACESAGVPLSDLMGWFSLKRLEDMTVGQYATAIKELSTRRAKGADLLR